MKKKLISALAAFSMIFSAAGNAFAIKYGEEWGNGSSSNTSETVLNETPQTPENTEIQTVTPAAVSDGTYKDVPSSHWAYKAVERCSKTKWFSGYPDGSFRPDGEITRAEAMKVFVTFMGEAVSEEVVSTSYHDVEPGAWYAKYIEAGKDLFPQRTTMDSQAKFQPDMPITREDTVYALVKALNYDQLVSKADESVLNMFDDKNSISEICRPYMAVAVSNELVSGYDDNTIGAQDPLTRAQFATLLYRATFVGPLAETQKKLVKVDIEPSTLKEITVGESFEITATATYSDGSTEDYSSQLNPYTDSPEGIITINKNKVTGVSAGTVLINYNNETVSDKKLVVVVKPDPNAAPEVTEEPVEEPTPEPVDPAKAGVVKANVDKEDMPAAVAKRYTVLVMDVSGSMYGSQKIGSAREAAKNFCSSILNANGEDRIAIVEYDNSARTLCDFTDDPSALTNAINTMDASGGTNFYDAFEKAGEMLDGVTDSDVLAKSMVFMTDGYPEHGPGSESGKYTYSDLSFYDLANAAYEMFESVSGRGYEVYTVGFCTNSETQSFLSDIQNKGYYNAANVDKLYDAFEKIAETITVSGVNVELFDGDKVIDFCSTNKGACDFSFTVNPGTYKLVISAPGYVTQTFDVVINSGDTADMGKIVLTLE